MYVCLYEGVYQYINIYWYIFIDNGFALPAGSLLRPAGWLLLAAGWWLVAGWPRDFARGLALGSFGAVRRGICSGKLSGSSAARAAIG